MSGVDGRRVASPVLRRWQTSVNVEILLFEKARNNLLLVTSGASIDVLGHLCEQNP